jgi:hypothetical protein
MAKKVNLDGIDFETRRVRWTGAVSQSEVPPDRDAKRPCGGRHRGRTAEPAGRPTPAKRGGRPFFLPVFERILPLFFLFLPSISAADILQFEGLVPPDVDKTLLNAEYRRLYKLVAPDRRPDAAPLRIVYYSEKSGLDFSGVLPEWGGGGTIGGNLIVIPTTFKPFLNQSFAQITRHEIVHAVLARAYPGLDIPRWFHEGAAMTLSGELSFEEDVVVSKAIFAGRLMPLSSIDSVNSFGRNRADLAYSQAHIAVTFLVEQYGIESIADILRSAGKTGSFWRGMENVLSLSRQEFEIAANKDLTSRYRFVFLFADYSAFWVLIALLFLVAAGAAIVRKQRKLSMMEQEEKKEDEARILDGAALAPGGIVASPSPPGTRESGSREEDIEIDGEGIADEEYMDESQYDDGDEDYDEDDDDYILADGVELEDDDESEDEEDEEDIDDDDNNGDDNEKSK